MSLAKGTTVHLNRVLAEHQGDYKREVVKDIKQNKVDQNDYHGGIRVGNHCMYMGKNGDTIVDAMTKVMDPKIRDPMNRKYLAEVSV